MLQKILNSGLNAVFSKCWRVFCYNIVVVMVSGQVDFKKQIDDS